MEKLQIPSTKHTRETSNSKTNNVPFGA
jgi:hypothetical protein